MNDAWIGVISGIGVATVSLIASILTVRLKLASEREKGMREAVITATRDTRGEIFNIRTEHYPQLLQLLEPLSRFNREKLDDPLLEKTQMNLNAWRHSKGALFMSQKARNALIKFCNALEIFSQNRDDVSIADIYSLKDRLEDAIFKDIPETNFSINPSSTQSAKPSLLPPILSPPTSSELFLLDEYDDEGEHSSIYSKEEAMSALTAMSTAGKQK